MPSATSAPPPDDSGTDAFKRFGYQAHIAFLFCLACYFERDVVAVYCEHWEDLLIEYSDRLRFVQIKTRDAGRGPWKYRHLLDNGGALRSLLRTHRALETLHEAREIEYEIRLEGAVDSADEDISQLAVGGGGATDEMCKRCAERLEIDSAEAKALLARVAVQANQPSRTLIEARNRDLLRASAGHLSANELKEIYDATVALIKLAMQADLLANAWPQAILEPSTAEEMAQQRARAKRIDRDLLIPILGRLEGGDQRLLVEITDPDRLQATALERKLIAAGASAELVTRAKQFRAQAAIRVAEIRGSSVDADALLGDLHMRLLNTAETVTDIVVGDAPAAEVWSELEQRLRSTPQAFDPRRLLGQDHLLLLGEVCQLSDECKFWWGLHA